MSTVEMPVHTAMSGEVLGIVPSAPLEVALRMMVEAGVRHLPVVVDGHCVGMLHESDVLWRLWSTTGRPPRAGSLARRPVLSAGTGDDARTVARRMLEEGTDVAVVQGDGRIVGIVTATDLLRLLANM